MSVTKTVLIAVSLVFGLATLASAAPRNNTPYGGYTYSNDIPGKSQQDHFTVTN